MKTYYPGEVVTVNYSNPKQDKTFDALVLSHEENPLELGFSQIVLVDLTSMKIHGLRLDSDMRCESKNGSIMFTINGKSHISEPINREFDFRSNKSCDLKEVEYSKNSIKYNNRPVDISQVVNGEVKFSYIDNWNTCKLKLTHGVSIGRSQYGYILRYFTKTYANTLR